MLLAHSIYLLTTVYCGAYNHMISVKSFSSLKSIVSLSMNYLSVSMLSWIRY